MPCTRIPPWSKPAEKARATCSCGATTRDVNALVAALVADLDQQELSTDVVTDPVANTVTRQGGIQL